MPSDVIAKTEKELLDGDALRDELEKTLPYAKKSAVFISAYITQSGVDWFCKYTPESIDRFMVCRLQPSDVLSGATHLAALETAIANGVNVFCLHSLHAKIYSIDDEDIYVGSANLTNNGLKIYGAGNLEACSKIDAHKANLDFINNIIESATELDAEILQNMQDCISLKEADTYLDKWPEGVMKEVEGVWVRDFFWSSPSEDLTNEQVHDMEIMGIQSFYLEHEELKERVLQTRCIRWLVSQLKEAPDQELYFGSITKLLHDDLKDDPAPYRKDVKTLLQNVLAYCEAYLTEDIEITRPSHSQRVKLITKKKVSMSINIENN